MLHRSSLLPLLAAPLLLAAACGGRDDDGPASALPPATAIPMGAVGAEGARFDPPASPKSPRGSGIQRKITPDENDPDLPLEPPSGDPSADPADPLAPPSPFGDPQTAPSTTPTTAPTPIHPRPPPIKKPKGTTI